MNTNRDHASQHAVREFLRQYGLTPETISIQANCSLAEVYGALHPELFEKCPLILVAKVWSAVELELSALGWQVEKELLWDRFNAKLRAPSSSI